LFPVGINALDIEFDKLDVALVTLDGHLDDGVQWDVYVREFI
jgi:hypothetical protein